MKGGLIKKEISNLILRINNLIESQDDKLKIFDFDEKKIKTDVSRKKAIENIDRKIKSATIKDGKNSEFKILVSKLKFIIEPIDSIPSPITPVKITPAKTKKNKKTRKMQDIIKKFNRSKKSLKSSAKSNTSFQTANSDFDSYGQYHTPNAKTPDNL
jgi:hypothetical protein